MGSCQLDVFSGSPAGLSQSKPVQVGEKDGQLSTAGPLTDARVTRGSDILVADKDMPFSTAM